MYNPNTKVQHQINESERTVSVAIDLAEVLTHGISLAPLSDNGNGKTHIIARSEGWTSFEIGGQQFALSVCVTAKKPKEPKAKKPSQADVINALLAQTQALQEQNRLLMEQTKPRTK